MVDQQCTPVVHRRARRCSGRPGTRPLYLSRRQGQQRRTASQQLGERFGGPAWTRVKGECGGQWYLHLFAPEQPDLNWNNADVRADLDHTLRFWLDRGVAGFRIDVAYGSPATFGPTSCIWPSTSGWCSHISTPARSRARSSARSRRQPERRRRGRCPITCTFSERCHRPADAPRQGRVESRHRAGAHPLGRRRAAIFLLQQRNNLATDASGMGIGSRGGTAG